MNLFQLNLCKALRMLCHGLATTPSSGELTEVDMQTLIASMKEVQAVKDLTWSSETLEAKNTEEPENATAPPPTGVCHTDVNLFSRLSVLRPKEEAAPLADISTSAANGGGSGSLKVMSATFPFADDVAEVSVSTCTLGSGTVPFTSGWKGEYLS